MKYLVFAFFVLGNLLFARLGLAEPSQLLDKVEELRLKNGMRFLLLRREGAPVFSAYIRVKVGGLDEEEGQTGIAHLLEHMAFKGTSTIGTKDFAKEKALLDEIEQVYVRFKQASTEGKKQLQLRMQALMQEASRYIRPEEFSRIYQKNGAYNFNATTSQDMTSYFVTLPNTKLELWAYLESERLKDPVFREFYAERDVVKEERRTRVEDAPFGRLYEAFTNMAFEKSPYRRPTIGYPKDIEGLSATDLQEFYKKYYVPSNMVGSIVGDIDLEKTKNVLERYFASIPEGAELPKHDITEVEPTEEKRALVYFDAGTMIAAGYLKPHLPHPDDYAFDVLEYILCEGSTSRLYQCLVEDKKIAASVACSSSTPGSRADNLFFIYVSVLKGKDPEDLLKAIDSEIHSIIKNGISNQEIARAKKNLLAESYYSMQSNDELADMLSYFDILDSWRYLQTYAHSIQSVTRERLAKLVQTYLPAKRRRVAILKRES